MQRRGEYRPHARFGVDVTVRVLRPRPRVGRLTRPPQVPWTAGSRAEPSWDEAASAHTTTRALDGAPPSGGASTALVLPSLAAASLAEDATRAVGCSDARPWERVGADGGAWGGAKPKAAPKQTPLPPVLHPDMEPGDAGAAAAAASCASAGAAAESRGASRSAAECFSEALRLHPASEAAHDWAVRASSAWARVKDWAGAVECARAAAAAAPTPPQQVAAHVLLGRACLGRADASEAGGAAALSRDALKRTLLDARDAFRAAKAADPHSAAAVAGAKEAGLAWMAVRVHAAEGNGFAMQSTHLTGRTPRRSFQTTMIDANGGGAQKNETSRSNCWY